MTTSTTARPTPEIVDRSHAVAIIGAGPAGLSAARMFAHYGVPYEQFERHTGPGGIWDIDNPGTPMYESAHFISSRDVSGFYGFPMPSTFGDYPTREQILQYTNSFADHFGLREHIEFGVEIESVVADGDTWIVTPAGQAPRRYRGVVAASGTNWHPRMPEHPGSFDGEVRHAVTHHDAREFHGKRVLVVGLGNSGADIACDAAQSADAAFISVRRGYHIVPKHVFGMPSDTFDAGASVIPAWIERPMASALLRLLVGDVTRWGLPKPDHKLFQTHPLLNSALLHHLQHGDIAVKPDIARFDGPDVVFTDGSREQVDVVLYATGYEMKIPYMDPAYFQWSGDRPSEYLTVFNRRHRNLFTLGFIETNSSAYTLFDSLSNLVAQYLRDQMHNPSGAAKFDAMIATDRPDLSGGLKMVDTPRSKGYVDSKTMRKYVAKVLGGMGWSPLTDKLSQRRRTLNAV